VPAVLHRHGAMSCAAATAAADAFTESVVSTVVAERFEAERTTIARPKTALETLDVPPVQAVRHPQARLSGRSALDFRGG
jgi:hypothetical protein